VPYSVSPLTILVIKQTLENDPGITPEFRLKFVHALEAGPGSQEDSDLQFMTAEEAALKLKISRSFFYKIRVYHEELQERAELGARAVRYRRDQVDSLMRRVSAGKVTLKPQSAGRAVA
jgi:predicted DNA-binding transcriptional regulator AlpA